MRTAKGLGSPFVVVEAIVRYQVQFLNLNLMCIFMTFNDVTLALWLLCVDVTCVPLVECGNCANLIRGGPRNRKRERRRNGPEMRQQSQVKCQGDRLLARDVSRFETFDTRLESITSSMGSVNGIYTFCEAFVSFSHAEHVYQCDQTTVFWRDDI